jgi:hypothetical protein
MELKFTGLYKGTVPRDKRGGGMFYINKVYIDKAMEVADVITNDPPDLKVDAPVDVICRIDMRDRKASFKFA